MLRGGAPRGRIHLVPARSRRSTAPACRSNDKHIGGDRSPDAAPVTIIDSGLDRSFCLALADRPRAEPEAEKPERWPRAVEPAAGRPGAGFRASKAYGHRLVAVGGVVPGVSLCVLTDAAIKPPQRSQRVWKGKRDHRR